VVDRVGPGRGVDLVGLDGEVVVAVQIPADLLGRRRAVDLDRVVVVAGLAAGAGPLAGADAGRLVARAARADASVPKTELRPLMSSRMSTSPLFGQVVPVRRVEPSIQNAGQ
jgi:hypothetical protein